MTFDEFFASRVHHDVTYDDRGNVTGGVPDGFEDTDEATPGWSFPAYYNLWLYDYMGDEQPYPWAHHTVINRSEPAGDLEWVAYNLYLAARSEQACDETYDVEAMLAEAAALDTQYHVDARYPDHQPGAFADLCRWLVVDGNYWF